MFMHRIQPLRIIAALGAIGLLLPLAGCGKVAEEATEKAIEASMPDGSSVEIDENGGQVSIQTTDGEGGAVNLQAGESVALPSDFPADIPVPQGVTWNLVQTAAAGVTAQGMLKTPLADVAAFMKSGLEGQGWTQETAFQQAGEMEMLSYKKGERTLSVTVSKADEETAIVIASQ
jgi:nitrogen fixation protein